MHWAGAIYINWTDHLPECTYKAATNREHGDVTWFGEGPVVGGKGPCERTVSQGNDKIDTPEKSHHIVDLQIEEVPLEKTLVVVFDKDAARWGATGVISRSEVLWRTNREKKVWRVYDSCNDYIMYRQLI